jgi:hypothetical protein
MFLFDYHVRESGIPGNNNIQSALSQFTLEKFNAFQTSQLIPTITGPTIDLTTDHEAPVLVARNAASNSVPTPISHNRSNTRRDISLESQGNTNDASITSDSRNSHVPNPRYVNDYSTRTIERNLSDTTALLEPGTVETLKPHPHWVPPFAAESRRGVNPSPFLDGDLHLASDKPSAVLLFYRDLCQLARAAKIALCPAHAIRKDCALWPSSFVTDIVYEMDALLVIKLTKDGVINTDNSTLALLVNTGLRQSDSMLKGYTFLHRLITRAQTQQQQNIPVTPMFNNGISILDFGSALITYYGDMAAIGCALPSFNQSIYFLTQLQSQGIIVDTFIDLIRSFNADGVLPPHLVLQELVLKVAEVRNNSSAPSVHVHQLAAVTNQDDDKDNFHVHRLATRNSTKSDNNNKALTFRQRREEQCQSCGTWGHHHNSCRYLAMTVGCLQHYSQDKKFCEDLFTKYKTTQNKSNKLRTVNKIRALFPSECEHLTDFDLLDQFQSDSDSDFC